MTKIKIEEILRELKKELKEEVWILLSEEMMDYVEAVLYEDIDSIIDDKIEKYYNMNVINK